MKRPKRPASAPGEWSDGMTEEVASMGRAGDSATSGQSLVDVDSLAHAFWTPDGALLALDDIRVEVRRGEFVAIVGPSGCGKTTLLRLLAGLERFQRGRLLIGGQPPALGRNDVGFVFQQDALWPWKTVRANVLFPLRMRKVPRRQAEEVVEKYLALTGLGEFASFYPHQLSGGMRQRANLCRALVREPALLLMDEPFASLDAHTRELMQLELTRIVRDLRPTVVFVTHDISEAVFLSDRVVCLSGRPGTVRRIVDVQVPRPRDRTSRAQPAFLKDVDELWKLITDDAASAHVPSATP